MYVYIQFAGYRLSLPNTYTNQGEHDNEKDFFKIHIYLFEHLPADHSSVPMAAFGSARERSVLFDVAVL